LLSGGAMNLTEKVAVENILADAFFYLRREGITPANDDLCNLFVKNKGKECEAGKGRADKKIPGRENRPGKNEQSNF